jgi:glyoxylase-like metal-dependent hydrolase (beta-lactamase superfamily II)
MPLLPTSASSQMNSVFDAAGLRVFERGWLSSNNILFAGNDSGESVLVDSGYWTQGNQTVALVRRALGQRRLDRLINTHLHSDHCGANHALQAEYDCRIDVPEGEAVKVDAWDEEALTYRATGQACPRFKRTGVLSRGNQTVLGDRSWQVIASPGHDPQSVVLYQPELGLLISADALWEDGFGIVFPELEGLQAFDEVRSTLDQLSKLPVRWVIPGHGAPFDDHLQAIGRAYARLDKLVANPTRHSRHAGKVLIKFHLLELRQTSIDDLLQWLDSTKYFALIHDLHFGLIPFRAWCLELVAELVQSGALTTHNGVIRNV